MAALKDNFSVVLKAGLPAREFTLLSQFAHRIGDTAEEHLLHFRCTKVDTSHHYFLSAEAIAVEGDFTFPVQVPHQYVFFVIGGDQRRRIGFLHDRD